MGSHQLGVLLAVTTPELINNAITVLKQGKDFKLKPH